MPLHHVIASHCNHAQEVRCIAPKAALDAIHRTFLMRCNPPGADRDGSGVRARRNSQVEGVVGGGASNPPPAGHDDAVLQVRPPVGVDDRFVPVLLDGEPPVQELCGEVLMLGPAEVRSCRAKCAVPSRRPAHRNRPTILSGYGPPF